MLKLLVPDMYLESIRALDPERLTARGIRGLIVDLDNTLVAWDDGAPGADLVAWVRDLERRGIRCCIVSNNRRPRVEAFGSALEIPFVADSLKPGKKAFRRAMRLLGTRASETAVLGDQLFTDVLGGNRAGLYTILVVPVSGRELPWTRLVRRVERSVLDRLAHRGLLEGPQA